MPKSADCDSIKYENQARSCRRRRNHILRSYFLIICYLSQQQGWDISLSPLPPTQSCFFLRRKRGKGFYRRELVTTDFFTTKASEKREEFLDTVLNHRFARITPPAVSLRPARRGFRLRLRFAGQVAKHDAGGYPPMFCSAKQDMGGLRYAPTQGFAD